VERRQSRRILAKVESANTQLPPSTHILPMSPPRTELTGVSTNHVHDKCRFPRVRRRWNLQYSKFRILFHDDAQHSLHDSPKVAQKRDQRQHQQFAVLACLCCRRTATRSNYGLLPAHIKELIVPGSPWRALSPTNN
jgi:hypothetical protein